MKNNLFFNKYLILLLAFFSRMIINVVGEVSPTFIFIIVTLPFWYKNIKSDKIAKKFSKLFYLIIVVQICWIPFAETNIITQIKGISITVSGLLFFQFYYFIFINRPSLLKWHLLGLFLASFIFINVLAEVAGGEFGFWKFQIYPRIITCVILICVWFASKKLIHNSAPFILIFIGGLGLATGARSSGLTPLLAGIIILFVQYKKDITLTKMKNSFVAIFLAMYLSYAIIYVPNVLNGNITGGNSDQLKQVENPYNPINLLMMGRTDSVVPFIAFLDKPITGWGYLTPDPNLKYHFLMNNLTDGVKTVSDRLLYRKDIPIPGHSVIGYYACSYGIIVLIILIIFIYRFSKFFFYSLLFKDKLLPYRAFIFINILWNLFFSPIPHFKTLPSNIAILIALSIVSIYNRKKNFNHDKY